MTVQVSAPPSTSAPTNQGGMLFARAQAYLPLTPGERALLRLIEGLACAALVAALPAVAGALGHGPVRWDDVARTALAAAAVAVLLALAKYARAQGDPALGAALAGVAGTLTAAPAPSASTTPAEAHVAVSTTTSNGT